ncbi:MmyB family transcriptional regulator [Cellulomonas wangsupingiae]|uniref:MmyB family transcriptional regulator n=1 Tax=Cellulomonas wangsupingiae TaxID=2968085 RepID=UPI0020304365|nr:hypothetical protein [Cellulomonas wangsupingiae]MCM0640903.1 hypothetical protein [Cellulomonas wangsupingiae]
MRPAAPRGWSRGLPHGRPADLGGHHDRPHHPPPRARHRRQPRPRSRERAEEALAQNPAAAALLGDESALTGLDRVVVHRWFMHPFSRDVYPVQDHDVCGRVFVSDLRAALARQGPGSRAEQVVQSLLARSEEFARVWAGHEVGLRHETRKRLVHPEVGEMSLECQRLVDVERSQVLLVFTAAPGTPDDDRPRLLASLAPRPALLTPS